MNEGKRCRQFVVYELILSRLHHRLGISGSDRMAANALSAAAQTRAETTLPVS